MEQWCPVASLRKKPAPLGWWCLAQSLTSAKGINEWQNSKLMRLNEQALMPSLIGHKFLLSETIIFLFLYASVNFLLLAAQNM